MDSNKDRPLKETAPAFVELQGLSRFFGDLVAVDGVQLGIRRGEIFAILGPSGCGKSTLLRLMAGLETPDRGKILLQGQDITEIPAYRRPVNMMFQSYALFPHMSVEENIAFGLKQENMPAEAIEQRIVDVLTLVHMQDYRRRKPAQLSGGQQQRVALARSLAKQPKLLLLDEPMGALDRKLRSEMQFELAEIIRRVRVTCVMVTHDQEEAMVMADRIALMDAGRIAQVGPPMDVYNAPNSRFSAGFLGEVNLLEGRIVESAHGTTVLEIPDIGGNVKLLDEESRELGSPISLAVRPEKILLSERPFDAHYNAVAATVEDLGFLGSQINYHLRLPGGRILSALIPSVDAPPGMEHGAEVFLGWAIRDGVLLLS